MGEGLLSGMLGGEEARDEPAEIGAEAFAAAVAANLSNHNPEVAARTAAFLQEQTKLLKTQRKTAEAEYQYFEAEWGPRLLGIRLRIAFQLLIAILAACVGAGVVILIVDAVGSHSVVIDQFETPPALVGGGLNGTVVASGLLDVLTQIQAATRSSAEHRSLSNAWTNDIAIDIPETGISIGQLQRVLKARFGHDVHVDGDLVQTQKGGLALTVRGSGMLPKTFAGEESDLGKLLTQAGEYIYGQSQPGLWANYLFNAGRYGEAILFCQTAYATVNKSERPYLLNYWAASIQGKGDAGANDEALALWKETIRIKPDYWVGYSNIMAGLQNVGKEEEAVHMGEQMKRIAGGRPGLAPEDLYDNYDGLVWDLQSLRASSLADMERNRGFGTLGSPSGTENLGVAQLDAQMHDPAAAALRLKTTPVDDKNLSDVANATMDRALIAEEQGDRRLAAGEWDSFAAAYVSPTVHTNAPMSICWSALSYEMTGQSAKADAALNAPGKAAFVDCYRSKADVLELRGDWAGAQAWYAKSVQLAPSIPSGYYSWGVALAKHGDLDGAMAKFKDANQKGPHWADPLKAWGDLLVKQHKNKQAIEKYDEALKYAPKWKDLIAARDALRPT